jgi:uncharacterized protein (TIRG00374 family)
MREGRKVGSGIWYTLLFSIVSICLIFRVVVKVPLRQSFIGINWFYIVLGFGALFLMWLAKASRMYIIGRGMGIHLKLFYYLQLYLATCFIAHITPFNSGGTPLQIYLLHKQGISVGVATVLTVVDLGLNTLMFLILIPVAVLINIQLIQNWHFTIAKPAFTILGIILSCVFIGWLLFHYSKLWLTVRQWSWILKLRKFINHKGWRQHLQHEWNQFKEGWSLLSQQHPLSIVWAIAAAVMYWLCYLIIAPMIFWAMGKTISFFDLIGWQLLFNFAQIFIPTPGGSGGSELILVYLFKNLTGASRIGTFVLLWKIYTFFSTLLVGSFFFWKLTKKVDR